MLGILNTLRNPSALTSAGLLVSFAAFFSYSIGPTIIGPYGDGLWYGALLLVGGFLLGYGSRSPDRGGPSGIR